MDNIVFMVNRLRGAEYRNGFRYVIKILAPDGTVIDQTEHAHRDAAINIASKIAAGIHDYSSSSSTDNYGSGLKGQYVYLTYTELTTLMTAIDGVPLLKKVAEKCIKAAQKSRDAINKNNKE